MKRCIKWFSIAVVTLLVSRVALQFFLPKPTLLADIPFSRAIYDDQQQLLRLTLSQDAKYRLLTPLKALPQSLIEATLLQEDQYFYWHSGIQPFALLRAIWHTYAFHTRRMGASTISMQVARLRFKINSKKLGGKIEQILRALQLEMHYSKAQILEAYFNLAPYGGNVEGVGSAAQLYFGKKVGQLALPEILSLVVIPQHPQQRIPQQGKLQAVRHKLFLRWLKNHPQDQTKAAWMVLPIHFADLKAAPFLAPHFVNSLLADPTYQTHELVTTLNLSLQQTIERVTNHYLKGKQRQQVRNAAVLLIDTREMSIKAMVGSANFFESQIGGQINGTNIKRSPGSTLKPFIYGLALDQGLIHPATVLKDVPRSFGSYNPENFDYDFMGPLKAKEALVLSRNIPAVFLAEHLTQPSLYDFLSQAKITGLKPPNYYGLALVLGGAELTLQELTTLYAMLANGGLYKPLRWIKQSDHESGQRLLSQEASFLVLNMLQETPLPFERKVSFGKNKSIAWKTGTSSGFRDAWTIGVIGPYVLAVWVGNFDNIGNPAFIGKDIAAPLFFDIVAATSLIDKEDFLFTEPPAYLNLRQIDVCKASGLLPTRYCLETEKTWFIPGKSPITTDTIFREVAINQKTGLRTCQFDENTRFEIDEFWPTDVLQVFEQAHIQRKKPPAFDETCTQQFVSDKGFIPQIVTPGTHLHYVMRLQNTESNRIPFTAVVDADVAKIHWFINEKYLGVTERSLPFYWQAIPGHYVVRVVDDHGRSDARELHVTLDN